MQIGQTSFMDAYHLERLWRRICAEAPTIQVESVHSWHWLPEVMPTPDFCRAILADVEAAVARLLEATRSRRVR
eukprot:2542421-Alexandrium_andersonii.AAC.1